jgi:hypothetical protein
VSIFVSIFVCLSLYVYMYVCIYIYIYIYTDKAARWAIGSSGVVFEWVENSMLFQGFSGKAGAESGDAESTR